MVFVTKRPQLIAFSPPVTATAAGSALALTATAGSSLSVTLTLVSGSATLNGANLIGLGGNVVVRAAQAGNDFYAAADSVDRTFSFMVGVLSPFITSPPLDQTVTAAIGTPAPLYQWQKDGVELPGATRSTFTIASALATDAGRFDVVATNILGSATSDTATLTVTTRDFSGVYFGRFAGGTGNAAVLVRPDRTAVFLGHLPGGTTGLAALDVRVDLAGRFSTSTALLGATA